MERLLRPALYLSLKVLSLAPRLLANDGRPLITWAGIGKHNAVTRELSPRTGPLRAALTGRHFGSGANHLRGDYGKLLMGSVSGGRQCQAGKDLFPNSIQRVYDSLQLEGHIRKHEMD